MNNKIFLILLFTGVGLLPLKSQILYFSVNDSIAHQSDIFEMELITCTYKQICNDQPYIDFSIRPITDEWVLMEWVGILGWYNMNQCNRGKWGGTILPSQNLFLNLGQESDKYGNIWIIGESGIVKTNPPGLLYEYKGPIDLSFYSVSWSTFLDGKVYSLGSLVSNKNQGLIIEFDTLNPMLSRIVSRVPPNFILKGIFPIHQSCGNNILVVATNSEFYEVDLKSGDLTFICNLVLPGFYNNTYLGSSPWPYNPKDCDVFLDLDINNSSGDMKNGFINTYSCKNRITLLSDIDPDVFSDYGLMDSITISILNPLDGKQEVITYQNTNAISVYQSNSYLTLTPSSGATNDSFKIVLKSLRYQNTSCMITEGDRFIQFIAYKNGITDTAYCTLHITGPFYFAGNDAQIKLCKSEPPFPLSNLLGACYTSGGTWSPALNLKGIFDPKFDTDSNYIYVVGDTICGFDTAEIKINLFDPPQIHFPNDTALCFGDSLLLSFNPTGLDFLWNDGSKSASNIIKNPGLYWLELTNSNNCSYRDSIRVSFNPINEIVKDVYICSNTKLSYKNKFYSPGDLFTDTLISPFGCDTFLKFHVFGIPVPAPGLIADTIICKDAITTISTDSNYKSYLWSTNQTSKSIQAKTGSYILTVTDQNDCSNTIAITIHEAPEIHYKLEPYNPLCNDDKGRIIMKTTSGGVSPIRYFLNGLESKNGEFDNLSPGTYISEIIDGEGCSKSDTLHIFPASAFNVSITDKIELEAGSSVIIKYIVLNGSIQLVSFNPNQDITLEGTDGLRIIAKNDLIYEIQFEDQNGCVITRTLQIVVKRNESLYFPNVFSPNGDNINDFWEPYIGSEFHFIQCKIFDRWGALVYSSSSKASWNGTFKNEKCLPGVYVFYLELSDVNNGVKKMSGEITLIR